MALVTHDTRKWVGAGPVRAQWPREHLLMMKIEPQPSSLKSATLPTELHRVTLI